MKSKKTITACLTALMIGVSLFAALPLGAQSAERYEARLAPAPPLGLGGRGGAGTPASFVAGSGSASATLTGTKLTVTATFHGLATPATEAKVGLGLAPGARLDLILDLKLTKSPEANPAGTSGVLEGAFDLTPAQVDGLRKGKLYIQINSEGAPKGHLLGWLLK